MELRVSFVGFPRIEARVGAKEVALVANGDTLGAVLAALGESHGDSVLRALCHDGKNIDSGIVVFRNDARVPADLGQTLTSGDQLSFVRMVAGG